eukprot:4797952-Amphidinium_carterae.1
MQYVKPNPWLLLDIWGLPIYAKATVDTMEQRHRGNRNKTQDQALLKEYSLAAHVNHIVKLIGGLEIPFTCQSVVNQVT